MHNFLIRNYYGQKMMNVQTHWRFLHDGNFMSSSFSVRQSINPILMESGVDVSDYAIKQSSRSLGLIARTPAAARALESRMADVLRSIATMAGQMIPVDIKSAPVAVITSPMTLYTIPTLVVMKGRKPWDNWRGQDLDDQHQNEMKELIRAGISSELKSWGIDWDASGIHLISNGRPMVLSGDGPRGMARLGVRFVAPWHIEGELFVGHMPYLGCGILKRGGRVHASTQPTAAEAALAASA